MQRSAENLEAAQEARERIEVEIIAAKHEVLEALGKEVDSDEARILSDRQKIEELASKMKEDEAEIESTMQHHERFAIGVTLLSIGITLSGMSVVTRRPHVWYVGLVSGLVGSGFVVATLFAMM